MYYQSNGVHNPTKLFNMKKIKIWLSNYYIIIVIAALGAFTIYIRATEVRTTKQISKVRFNTQKY